jgi:hypothetical protein
VDKDGNIIPPTNTEEGHDEPILMETSTHTTHVRASTSRSSALLEESEHTNDDTIQFLSQTSQHTYEDEEYLDDEPQPSTHGASGSAKKKKTGWFKRRSSKSGYSREDHPGQGHERRDAKRRGNDFK